MNPQDPGLLLAFEGVDGCGKGTQIGRLAGWLEQNAPGRRLHVLREPGGTELGERVREVLLHGDGCAPLTEMLLYMASRAELYASRVLPALAAGDVVILDRSHYSTAAYQGAGLGLDEADILDLAARVIRGRHPDRVILLDLPADRARARRAGEQDDRIESRDDAYFASVAEAYRRFARSEPERFVVIDGDASPDDVAAAVRRGLADML